MSELFAPTRFFCVLHLFHWLRLSGKVLCIPKQQARKRISSGDSKRVSHRQMPPLNTKITRFSETGLTWVASENRFFKAAPHNVSCESRQVFCSFRAVLKAGNTRSVFYFQNFHPGQNPSPNLAVSLCGAELMIKLRSFHFAGCPAVQRTTPSFRIEIPRNPFLSEQVCCPEATWSMYSRSLPPMDAKGSP